MKVFDLKDTSLLLAEVNDALPPEQQKRISSLIQYSFETCISLEQYFNLSRMIRENIQALDLKGRMHLERANEINQLINK